MAESGRQRGGGGSVIGAKFDRMAHSNFTGADRFRALLYTEQGDGDFKFEFSL